MFRDQALDDEGAAFRIEAHGKPIERHLPHRLAHARHVVGVVRHLIVGDQERAVVTGLQLHPVLERARVMAKMQGAGGPDPGQYPLLAFHFTYPLLELNCVCNRFDSGPGASLVSFTAGRSRYSYCTEHRAAGFDDQSSANG